MCCCLSLCGSCQSCVALMCVGDLSTTGPDARERTGLQPGQSVSTLVLLLGNRGNVFELINPELVNIHTAGMSLKQALNPSHLQGG